MSYNLFLDDLRTPESAHSITNFEMFLSQKWEIVRSYQEFVDHITKHGVPDFVSFDHDLGYDEQLTGREKSGYDCAQWLVEYCIKHHKDLPEFYIHSMNPIGRNNIEKAMAYYYRYHKLMDSHKNVSEWNCNFCFDVDYYDESKIDDHILRTCYTCGSSDQIKKGASL